MAHNNEDLQNPCMSGKVEQSLGECCTPVSSTAISGMNSLPVPLSHTTCRDDADEIINGKAEHHPEGQPVADCTTVSPHMCLNIGDKLREGINDLPTELMRHIIEPILEQAMEKDIYLIKPESIYIGGEKMSMRDDDYELSHLFSAQMCGEDDDAGIKAFRLFETLVTEAARFAIIRGRVRDRVLAIIHSQRVQWNARVKKAQDPHFVENATEARAQLALIPKKERDSRDAMLKTARYVAACARRWPREDLLIARDMFNNGIFDAVIHLLKQTSMSMRMVNFMPWDEANSEPISPRTFYQQMRFHRDPTSHRARIDYDRNLTHRENRERSRHIYDTNPLARRESRFRSRNSQSSSDDA